MNAQVREVHFGYGVKTATGDALGFTEQAARVA